MSKPRSYDEAYALWSVGRKASMSINRELYEAIVEEVGEEDVTLEFGCGLSTFAFEGGRRHFIVESDGRQARLFSGATASPLKDGWYTTCPKIRARVILVDGPSLESGGCRANGVEMIAARCVDETVLFIDDVHRDDEMALTLALADTLNKAVVWTDRWATIL